MKEKERKNSGWEANEKRWVKIYEKKKKKKQEDLKNKIK